MDILARILKLSQETQRVIDLRCDGTQWSVHAEVGNTMALVPGSVKDTAVDAVNAAWKRWEHRSVDRPFLNRKDRPEDRYVP